MTEKVSPELEFIEKLMDRCTFEPNSGCWLWLGHIKSGGYGGVHYKGKTTRVHRAMWRAQHGPIPDGVFVCHKCDVPSCINPDHLFLGTCADNNRDRRAKRRDHWFRNPKVAKRDLIRAWSHPNHIKNIARGSNHVRAKLTENDVREIRRRARNGARQIALAREFSVRVQTISKIVKRQAWRHVE